MAWGVETDLSMTGSPGMWSDHDPRYVCTRLPMYQPLVIRLLGLSIELAQNRHLVVDIICGSHRRHLYSRHDMILAQSLHAIDSTAAPSVPTFS